jgi:hypothetical protein
MEFGRGASLWLSHNRIRLGLSAVAVAGLVSIGAASAQTPPPPPASNSPITSASPTLADVEKWTADQWDAAKAKWSKENSKWSGCEQQASDQKLTGRQSWVFLYKCMFMS